MNTETAGQPSTATIVPVEVSLADLSLADYRAQREGKTAAKEPKSAAAAQTPSTPDAGEAAVDADELDTSGTPEQQVERKKKLGGFQKTIARQSDEIADLKRKLEAKEASAPTPPAAAASTPAAPATPKAAPEPVYQVPKPKLEDCEGGIEEYTEKLADWKADERDWKKEQKDQATQRATESQKLIDRWSTSKTAFKAEHDDYDAVLAGVDNIKMSAEHQRLFLDSENGVALAYHLAQDPDELKKFAALSPTQAGVQFGKLEHTLFPAKASTSTDADTETDEPQVSQAPRPFKAVSGQGTRVKPNPANLSAADYRKARESGRLV